MKHKGSYIYITIYLLFYFLLFLLAALTSTSSITSAEIQSSPYTLFIAFSLILFSIVFIQEFYTPQRIFEKRDDRRTSKDSVIDDEQAPAWGLIKASSRAAGDGVTMAIFKVPYITLAGLLLIIANNLLEVAWSMGFLHYIYSLFTHSLVPSVLIYLFLHCFLDRPLEKLIEARASK